MTKEYISNISKQLSHIKNSLHKMAHLAIFTLFVLLGLAVLIINQYLNLPTPNYFATTSDGEIIQLK